MVEVGAILKDKWGDVWYALEVRDDFIFVERIKLKRKNVRHFRHIEWKHYWTHYKLVLP